MCASKVNYSRNAESEIWYGIGYGLRKPNGRLRLQKNGMPLVHMTVPSAEAERRRGDRIETVEVTAQAVTPRISSNGV
jgi:hypothetical protein